MLIADGDADEDDESFDGSKVKWKAYTLLRKQFKRIERQKRRAYRAKQIEQNGGKMPLSTFE